MALGADRLFAILLALLYFALATAYAFLFWGRFRLSLRYLRALLVFTIVGHLAYFLSRALLLDDQIFRNPIEILSGMAMAIALAYFLIEWVTGERGTGIWILSLAFFCQAISCFGQVSRPDSTIPQTPLVSMHIGMALVGYCAFSLSAAYSFMYLVLYHKLKIRSLGIIFNRLPSLEVLERMAYRSTHFGVGFLVLSLLMGIFLLHNEDVSAGALDPKILMAVLACFFYSIGIVLRSPLRIRGKRFAIFSLIGFCLIFILLFAGHYLSGFHQFRGEDYFLG